MSEYIVRKSVSTIAGWDVVRGEEIIKSFSYFGDDDAHLLAILLNNETETLRQQIADLQAENAKLKADCASYDKVLNQVAIGYLDATEKLQAMEAIESPALPVPEETAARVDTQETRVQVNWSGRGFSSGSYKRIGNFARFEKFWTVIEIDRANKVSQMWIASDKCRLV